MHQAARPYQDLDRLLLHMALLVRRRITRVCKINLCLICLTRSWTLVSWIWTALLHLKMRTFSYQAMHFAGVNLFGQLRNTLTARLELMRKVNTGQRT
jgi:hypothetical protein